MNKSLKVLRIFYLKLVIPGVLFSLLASVMTGFSVKTFGLSFQVIFPLIHYFIYERLKNEYIFYANFGFSRSFLWVLTVIISLIINIITNLI